MKKATEEVRVQSADQERESQLRQSALQKKCAELRSEQAINDATLGRVRAVEPVAERARARFAEAGLAPGFGRVTPSDRPDLGAQLEVAQEFVEKPGRLRLKLRIEENERSGRTRKEGRIDILPDD